MMCSIYLVVGCMMIYSEISVGESYSFEIGLFVVSITVLGFMFILNKVEKKNEIVLNILIAVSVIVILPSLMAMMEDLLHEGLDVVEIDGNISDNVLKRNIADVKYYVD